LKKEDRPTMDISRETGILRDAFLKRRRRDAYRRLLVGSAHYILGTFASDSDLRRHGEKIASRGAKNAKKRAVS
jgi:hypothetical protein